MLRGTIWGKASVLILGKFNLLGNDKSLGRRGFGEKNFGIQFLDKMISDPHPLKKWLVHLHAHYPWYYHRQVMFWLIILLYCWHHVLGNCCNEPSRHPGPSPSAFRSTWPQDWVSVAKRGGTSTHTADSLTQDERPVRAFVNMHEMWFEIIIITRMALCRWHIHNLISWVPSSLSSSASWWHPHLLRAGSTSRHPVLWADTSRQCVPWSVALRNHRVEMRQDPIYAC